VLTLGVVFAHYDRRLLIFGALTVAVLVILARYAPWMLRSRLMPNRRKPWHARNTDSYRGRRGSVVQHNTSMYIEKITQVIHSQKAKLR
jgi:hypothetical protein